VAEDYIFHSWVYIYNTFDTIFLGENITKYYVRFRKCNKCGIIQRFSDCWTTLSQEETEIVNKKIKEINYNGKPAYVIEEVKKNKTKTNRRKKRK